MEWVSEVECRGFDFKVVIEWGRVSRFQKLVKKGYFEKSSSETSSELEFLTKVWIFDFNWNQVYKFLLVFVEQNTNAVKNIATKAHNVVCNSVFEVIYSFFQCKICRFYKILWNSSKTRVKKCELSELASFHESSTKRVRSSVEVSKNSKINQFWVKCEVETRVNSSFNLTYRIPDRRWTRIIRWRKFASDFRLVQK